MNSAYLLSEGLIEFGGDRSVYRIVIYDGSIQEVRPGTWHHRTLSAIFDGLTSGVPRRDSTHRYVAAESKAVSVMALYDPSCYYGKLLRRVVLR